MSLRVRLGGPSDVDASVSVYERSNLARRKGDWPQRAERVAQVVANHRSPGAWFLLGFDGTEPVAMALVVPFREDLGAGATVPGEAFLGLLFVIPERWGEGIGGLMLDAVIAEAARHGCTRIHLWTHERDNERAQRLYASRGFRRTGVSQTLDGELTAEWMREG
jgi:GNAT superfamily N-acetyltransferase